MYLVRQLISNATGEPISGKTVTAKPIWDVNGDHIRSMPETPSGSGYYISSEDLPHDNYKIIVNGQDSGDEICLKPGRVCIGSQGSTTYPPAPIDRVVNAKCTLSMFVPDNLSAPNMDDISNAVAFAVSTNKVLVLDYDIALTTSITTPGKLIIDLNGHTLDCSNGSISAGFLFVSSGDVALRTGAQSLVGTYALRCTDVNFSGNASSQLQAKITDAYIGCTGLAGATMVFSKSGYDYTKPLLINTDFDGDSSRLILTDLGLGSGKGRLTALQKVVDEDLDRIVEVLGTKTGDGTTPYVDGKFTTPIINNLVKIGENDKIADLSDFVNSDPVVIDGYIGNNNPLLDGNGYILNNSKSGMIILSKNFSEEDFGLYEVSAGFAFQFYHWASGGGTNGTAYLFGMSIYLSTSQDTLGWSGQFSNSSIISNSLPALSVDGTSIFVAMSISAPTVLIRVDSSNQTIHLHLPYMFACDDSSYADRGRLKGHSIMSYRKVGV